MKVNVIAPSASLLQEKDPLRRIELAGRICYHSQDKVAEGTAEPFVRRLLANRHLTPLEAVNLCIPLEAGRRHDPDPFSIFGDKWLPPSYNEGSINDRRMCRDDDVVYISARDLAEKYVFRDDVVIGILKDPDVSKTSVNTPTLIIRTDRGIGNELVRHRALAYDDDRIMDANPDFVPEMSMVQESTRYVKYDAVEVIRPRPAKWAEDTESLEYRTWWHSCIRSAIDYRRLLDAGVAPQYARNVLPLSLATTIVMTGTTRQWDHFFYLRTAKAAHPQMRYLCWLMLKALDDAMWGDRLAKLNEEFEEA